MKLLFKHIYRRILQAPLQPLLILLTVAISVAASVTSLRMRDVISEHADAVASLDVELGDLLISVRGDAGARMLFADDAEALIGDAGTVFGEFSLTAFRKQGTFNQHVSVSAVDLVAADRYFDFEYTALGTFTTANLRQSVIVSDTFAEKNGLTLGDSLVLSVLGEEQTYTVQGIAKADGILEDRDVLISTSSFLRLLANWIPSLSGYPVSLCPCNRLMIRLDDPARADEMRILLQASDTFGEQSVELTYDAGEHDFTVYTQQMGITVMAFLIILLAAILITTCLQLLQKQRSDDYALFCLVGASRRMLWYMQLAEAMLYALGGSVLGLLLAQPMIDLESGAFAWLETPVSMRVQDAAIGVLMAFILMLLCAGISIFRRRNHSMSEWLGEASDVSLSRKRVLPLVLLAVLCAGLVGISYALPMRHRAIPGFGATFACVGVLFLLAPFCISSFASLLERVLERKCRRGTCFVVAVKSLKNHASLAHVARLFSVLVAILIVISTCAQRLETQCTMMEETISADLVAVNASDDAYDQLKARSDVAGVARVEFFPSVQIGDQAVPIGLSVSGDVEACILKEMLPEKLPTGDELILSEGLVTLLEMEIGDPVTVEFQGVPYTFRLVGTLSMTVGALYVNAADMGIPQNALLCVSFKEDMKTEDALAKVTALLETDGAVMLERETLFLTMPQTMAGFVFLLQSSVSMAATLAFVGCVNVLYAHYRSRKEERRQLRCAGTTRRQMLAMHLMEFLPILVISLLLAVLFGGIMCIIVDGIARSFGVVLL